MNMRGVLLSLSLVLVGCGGSMSEDAGVDAGGGDAGRADAGGVDAGRVDAGAVDAGRVDAGAVDAGAVDAGEGDDAGFDGGVDAGPDAGACAFPAEETSEMVLSVGHVDMLDVGWACGGLHLALADGTDRLQATAEVLRAPEHLLLHGTDALLLEVPPHADFPEFAFLGPEGSMVYMFQEVQTDGTLWPGLKSYRVPRDAVTSLALRLESLAGPGPMFAFYGVTPGMAVPFAFNVDAGITETPLTPEVHVHLNWAFPLPGLYRANFRALAQLTDGGVVESALRQYRFLLGPLSGLPATEPTVITVEGLSESGYQQGETMTLSVQQHGAASLLPVRWERQCYLFSDAGYQLVDGGIFLRDAWETLPSTNGVLSVVPVPSCQYRAALMEGERRVVVSQSVIAQLN